MRASGTILCAIPKTCWDNRINRYPTIDFLRRFLRDLTVIERRLPKNIAREDEALRYEQLCGRIEQITLSNAIFAPSSNQFSAALRSGRFPSIRVGSEYIDLIRHIQLDQDLGPSAKGRLGATVFSPREIKAHVPLFETTARALDYQHYTAIKHRMWFLSKRVTTNGCGLIEIPDPLSVSLQSEQQQNWGSTDGRDWWERLWEQLIVLIRENPKPAMSAEERRTQIQAKIVAGTTSNDWQHYEQANNRGHFIEDRLKTQIQAAITNGVPVNLMNQRQNVLTVVFQEFIHEDRLQRPVEIPLIYNDGRSARPFPLHCLPKLPDGWTPTKEYHFALISMRHLPLDKYIDMNWYRNIEVPTGEGLAASDESCYQYSMRQLAQLLSTNKAHRLRIHLYHTGYMPAIVGFYRAVMSILRSGNYGKGCLQVIPKLQPEGDDYAEGRPWPE